MRFRPESTRPIRPLGHGDPLSFSCTRTVLHVRGGTGDRDEEHLDGRGRRNTGRSPASTRRVKAAATAMSLKRRQRGEGIRSWTGAGRLDGFSTVVADRDHRAADVEGDGGRDPMSFPAGQLASIPSHLSA